MKTTVEIPDDLFRKAKTLAASRGLSFKDVLVHSLASELDNIIDIGLENKNNTQPKRKETRKSGFGKTSFTKAGLSGELGI